MKKKPTGTAFRYIHVGVMVDLRFDSGGKTNTCRGQIVDRTKRIKVLGGGVECVKGMVEGGCV